MKRQAFTFWQAAGLLAFIGVLAAILFPVFGRPRTNARKSFCQSNLKQVALGIAQYMQDYDEKFPQVSIGREGWADTLQPYLKSSAMFWCNLNPKVPNNTTDFFYNARLAGQQQAKLYAKSTYTGETPIILLGDGTIGAGTNAHLTELPFEWLRDDESPARRHFGGANYAFVDGHVKRFKSEAVLSNRAAKKGEATFSLD